MQSQQASSRPSGISAHRDWRIPFATHHTTHQRKLRWWKIALLAAAGLSLLSLVSHVALSRATQASDAAQISRNVAIAATLVTFAILFFRPQLRCPRCEGRLKRLWKSYCSECGSGKVHQPPFFGWRMLPRCDACGREPVKTRAGRSYAIRFCTHCGAYVHETGV